MPLPQNQPRMRQTARGPQRDSDIPLTSTVGMQKVSLPRIRGTPSSRKQYSYGAAEEPVAPRRLIGRPTDNLSNDPQRDGAAPEDGVEVLNMQRALSHAMRRQAEAEAQDTKPNPQAKPAPKVKTQQNPRQSRGNAEMDDELASSPLPPPRPNQPTPSEDLADDRSFRMESDVFGDATIVSSIGEPSPVPVTQSSSQVSKSRRLRQTKASQNPTAKDMPARDDLADQVAVPKVKQTRSPVSKKARTRTTKDPTFRNNAGDDSSSDNEEGEPEQAGLPKKNGSSRRKARRTKDPTFRDGGGSSSDEQSPSRQRSRPKRKQPQTNTAGPQAGSAMHAHHASTPQTHEDSSARRTEPRPSDEDWTADASRQHAFRLAVAEGVRGKKSEYLGSDYSEQDSAFQEDIYRRDLAEELARKKENRRQLLRQARTKFSAFLREARQAITHHTQRGWPMVRLAGQALLALCAAVLLFPYMRALLSEASLASPTSWNLRPLHSLGTFAGTIKASLPSFSQPSWEKILHEADLDENGKISVDDFLAKYGQHLGQIAHVKETVYKQQKFLERVSEALPKVVALELDSLDKPIIAQDFYDALLDMIQTDWHVVTIDEDGKLSDQHRKVLAMELLHDGEVDSKVDRRVETVMRDAASEMEDRLTTKWEAWVRRNDAKVDMIKNGKAEEAVLLDRQEILDKVRSDLNRQRLDYQADLRQLNDTVKAIIQEKLDSMDLGGSQDARPADPLTRTEIDQIISHALANAGAERFAKDQIQNTWEATFKNRVNYFSEGSGAVINLRTTSANYEPARGHGANGKQKTLSNALNVPRKALHSWEQDGDAWCAAKTVNFREKPHGYQLGVIIREPVIPQHVVIEHILPGATIDPEARPRDIEIWISVEDPETRELVKDFESTHLPTPDPSEENASLPEDYVRIARYKYQGAEVYDGKHYQPLSEELVAIGAATQNVVVRAVTNYGSTDHTCFYRVRMYGQSSPVEIIEEA